MEKNNKRWNEEEDSEKIKKLNKEWKLLKGGIKKIK